MRCTKSTGCRREYGHAGGCGAGGGRTFEDIRTLDALVHRRIGFDGQPAPTVPASEHQRVQAERDEAKDEAARLRSSVQWHRSREAHFADVLGIADGGQYRNDWDCRLQKLLDAAAESADLRARLADWERSEVAAKALRDDLRARLAESEKWMRQAMEAIKGLAAGPASFTGHPVVDVVAELRARLERAESLLLAREDSDLQVYADRLAAEVRRAVEEAVAKTKAECADIADGRVTRDEPVNALSDWQRGYSRGRQDAASAIRARGKK